MPKRKPDRVVLDTNVVVSAAISGRFSEIIALSVIEGIAIYTCSKQIQELQSTFSKTRVRKLLSSSPGKYITIYKTTADKPRRGFFPSSLRFAADKFIV
jgi:predicted nucleic acid-binding protein